MVSVYLSLGQSATGYGGEIGLRWRALRERLVERGVDDVALAPLDERITATAPCPRTLCAFVRDGKLEAQELEELDGPDLASVGPLPIVVPLLGWRQRWVPYVTVLTDRTGADLAAFLGAGAPVATENVIGPDD